MLTGELAELFWPEAWPDRATIGTVDPAGSSTGKGSPRRGAEPGQPPADPSGPQTIAAATTV